MDLADVALFINFMKENTFFFGSCLFLREMRISGVSSSSIFWRHHTIFFVWFWKMGGDFLFPSPLGQGQYIHKHLPPSSSSSSQVVSSKLVVFGHPSFGLFCPFWTGSKFVRCCDRCGSFCAIRLLWWDGRENGPNVPVVGWPAGHTRRALLL